MAMRSAMRRVLAAQRQRRWGRQHQGDREDRALPRARAVRTDVAAHASRQLPRDREPQPGAMRDAFTAAAVVEIEEFLGTFRRKAAPLVTDVQAPVAVADTGREPHAAATV